MNHHCRVPEQDLGPYLLGQLEPGHAAEVAEQVGGCPSCADEVARLRPVVAAMAAGSAPEAGAPRTGVSDLSLVRQQTPARDRAAAGPAGLDRVLSTVRREQRSRMGRRLLLAAAAVVVALLVGGTAVLATSPDGREVQLAGSAGAGGTAAASAVLREQRWGTAIELEVRGLDPRQTYGVWLERREGGRLPAGSFSPRADGTVRVSLGSGLALADSGAVGVALLEGGRGDPAVDVLSAQLG